MINNVVLAGRICKAPETKEKSSGAVTTFRLAVDREFAKEGGQQSDFFNCVCFGKTAENVAQYCDKGMPVALTGRVEIDQVEQDGGGMNYYTKVIAQNVRFLETKAQAEARRASSGTEPQTRTHYKREEEQEEDPFGDQ